MAKIVPAILEETEAAFLDGVARVTKIPGVERIHVDFGDGIFIPKQLLSAATIDALNPAYLWEAHLMVKEPKEFLDYKISGFSTVIVHYEAFDNSRSLHEALAAIKQLGLKAGICINIGTPVEVLKDFEKHVSHFQLMSVHSGAQGTPFLEEVYEKIKNLRKLIPGAIIEIDGGVNFENAKKLVDSGADILVAGSVLIKSSDMVVTYEKLQAEIRKR